MDEQELNRYQESAKSIENPPPKEHSSPQELIKEEEFSRHRETGSDLPQKEKKANQKSLVGKLAAGSAAAVTAVVLVTATGLLNVNLKGSFDRVEYDNGSILYSASFTGAKENNALYLKLYDEEDAFVEQIDLEPVSGVGAVEGVYELNLDPILPKIEEKGTLDYHITLEADVGLGVHRQLDRYAVRIEGIRTSIGFAYYRCDCKIDGYLRFLIDKVDPASLIDGIAVTLADSLGTAHPVALSDDLSLEQEIFVGDLPGGEGTLSLAYRLDGAEQTPITQTVVI